MNKKTINFAEKIRVSMFNEFYNYISSIPDASDVERHNDNTLFFKYKDLIFVFATETSDPYYIRLMLPNIAKTDDIKDSDVYKVINEYNDKFKVVKMSIFNDNSIWLSAEQLIYSKENASLLFMRMINILESVINDFRKNTKQ